MSKGPDVLYELFGDASLTTLTTAFEKELANMLWHIKGPLGDTVYSGIRKGPIPAEALVHTLYDRRLDKSLVDAFRNYVLTSDSLYFALCPKAKREADLRRPAKAQAPATSWSPPTATEPDLPKLTSVEALRAALASSIRQGKVFVVLFMKPSSVVCRSFSTQIYDLTRSDRDSDFFMVDLTGAATRDLETEYKIAGIPTTLVFSSQGFRRVVGADCPQVKEFINQAKQESDEAKDDSPSEAVQIVQTRSSSSGDNNIYDTPQPPEGWGPLTALVYWVGLPDDVNDVTKLAIAQPSVRARLYHVMPYIADRDPRSHRHLTSKVLANFCAHHFSVGQAMISCFDCGVDGEFADYCIQCYVNSDHNGHVTKRRVADHPHWTCDCGRFLGGTGGSKSLTTCSNHTPTTMSDDDAEKLLRAMVGLTILGAMADSK